MASVSLFELSSNETVVFLACGISGTVGDEGSGCRGVSLSSVGLLGNSWKYALSGGNENSVLPYDTARVLLVSISAA